MLLSRGSRVLIDCLQFQSFPAKFSRETRQFSALLAGSVRYLYNCENSLSRSTGLARVAGLARSI